MFRLFLSSFLISLFIATSEAFVGPVIHSNRNGKHSAITKESKTKLDLFLAPQIGFAAACAGAVFAYVYSNIDSIKETQKIATDKAMSEQSASLKSAEAGQKAALEKVKAQQAANIARARQVAIDAKERADAIGREAAKRK